MHVAKVKKLTEGTWCIWIPVYGDHTVPQQHSHGGLGFHKDQQVASLWGVTRSPTVPWRQETPHYPKLNWLISTWQHIAGLWWLNISGGILTRILTLNQVLCEFKATLKYYIWDRHSLEFSKLSQGSLDHCLKATCVRFSSQAWLWLRMRSKCNAQWPDFSTEQLSNHQTGRLETRAPLSSYIHPFPSSGGPTAQDQSMCILVSSHSLPTRSQGPGSLCCQKTTPTFPFAFDAARLSPISYSFFQSPLCTA